MSSSKAPTAASKHKKTPDSPAVVDVPAVNPEEPEVQVKVFQPPTLSSIAGRLLRERLSDQEKVIEQLTADFSRLRLASSSLSFPLSRPFLSWESLSKNQAKFRYYTGLSTTGIFSAIMQHCAEPLKSLTVRSNTPTAADAGKPSESGPAGKMGRPRSLSLENEFLLVLVWLRHAFKQEVMADLFRLSSHYQVSYLVNAWVPFLASELDSLLKWPSKEEVKANLPDSFRNDPETEGVRVILDCYEVWIEKPSSLSLNAALYSDYKGHTTYKVLVGVTPTGYISFISEAYPGAISDPAITRQSGLLDKMQPGDYIMADKGFTLSAADLQPRGIKLTLPPFSRRGQADAGKPCCEEQESCQQEDRG